MSRPCAGLAPIAVAIISALAPDPSRADSTAIPTGVDPVTIPAGLNLGLTSFNDGQGSLIPGALTLADHFRLARLHEITDQSGKSSTLFRKPRIDVDVDVAQILYNLPLRLPGGVLGVTVLLPIVDLDTHLVGPGAALTDNGFGIGDLVFGPYYQFRPIGRPERVSASVRVELDTIAPIGKFDRYHAIDQGSGYWSLNPHVAFTITFAEQFELSARIHYLANFETDQAPGQFVLPIAGFRNGQAGTVGWVNFAGGYQVARAVQIGVSGFYLDQLTDDRFNGQAIPNTRKQQLYLGPGMQIVLTEHDVLNLNSYIPAYVRGLASGFQVGCSLFHTF